MHHVALDRTGPHDRDLDDKVVELSRFEPRQHVDLRAAFDLEDTDAVAVAQHVVDRRALVADDRLQLIPAQPVQPHQVERLADAGEHPEREDIDLHQPQRVDIVLVPFDEGAVLHRAVMDRHGLVEPVLRQHEAADVLRQMAREFEQPVDQPTQPRDLGIVGIEPGLAKALLLEAVGEAAPDRAGQRARHVRGQPQRLADLAHRRSWPVMDHRRRDRRAFAAIAAIDILHHLLAPFMLEIDIDIGRLVAFGGDEAREQQVVLQRIDRGDAEQPAHRRIRRRSAPLAQDRRVLVARELHDVVHGQEIIGVVAVADQRQFLRQQFVQLGWNAVGKARTRRRQREMLQPVLRVPSLGYRLVRIFIFQVVEREVDPGEQPLALGHRLGPIAEQPGHLARILQMPLAIRGESQPRPLDGDAVADAGDDVVQRPVARLGIQRVAGGEQRHPGDIRDLAPASPADAGRARRAAS